MKYRLIKEIKHYIKLIVNQKIESYFYKTIRDFE